MIPGTPSSGGGARRTRHPSAPSVRTGLLLAFLAAMAGAQPLTFQSLLVDDDASGDDKEVADIDGDGDLDGILGGATLSWYRSNGAARTFDGPFLIRAATVEFTTDMAVGDIDADG